ncbi:MAG: hypothetical protein HRT58_09310 [Crocinitomicaceae bacterium]|nr:hypothetical protein [Flavobacteriales bacterium]NQZ35851.1 hypothetical protein [Crocinitomicaceae bacterium]
MKRVIYIGMAVFALGMVSCSKQDIQPNSTSETIVPSWKSGDGENADPSLGGTGGPVITDPEIDNGEITDPEIDN